MSETKPPKELDTIVDKALAYRPKLNSEAAKTRKSKVTKIKRRKQGAVEPAAS